MTKLFWWILLNKILVDEAWMFMADYRVIMQTDYNIFCLDASGYVTTGNSRVASGYQNSVRTYHCHLQSRIDETVLLDIRQCILL